MKFSWKTDAGKAFADPSQQPAAASAAKPEAAAALPKFGKLDTPRPAPVLAKPASAPAAPSPVPAVLQLPLSSALKHMIEAVADANGRSVAAEIEIRLEQSLRDDRLEVLLHDILGHLPKTAAPAAASSLAAARRPRRKNAAAAASAIKIAELNLSNDK